MLLTSVSFSVVEALKVQFIQMDVNTGFFRNRLQMNIFLCNRLKLLGVGKGHGVTDETKSEALLSKSTISPESIRPSPLRSVFR